MVISSLLLMGIARTLVSFQQRPNLFRTNVFNAVFIDLENMAVEHD